VRIHFRDERLTPGGPVAACNLLKKRRTFMTAQERQVRAGGRGAFHNDVEVDASGHLDDGSKHGQATNVDARRSGSLGWLDADSDFVTAQCG
jgi:hypothetical protein